MESLSNKTKGEICRQCVTVYIHLLYNIVLADKQMKCEGGWGLGSRVQRILLFLENKEPRPCDGCKITI
jgi:hypothetical protein